MNKKSILFIADKPNWAYHFIILTWAELLPEFDCYIAFTCDYEIRINNFKALDVLKTKVSRIIKPKNKNFNIHPSKKYAYPVYKERPVYTVLENKKTSKTDFDFIIEMGYFFQYTAHLPFTSKKKLVGVYTDSFPHEGPTYDVKTDTDLKKLSRQEFYNQYLKPYDGIILGNNNLYEDYKALSDKLLVAYGNYLQNEFIENHTIGQNESLTIAWTGNPNREMKGFREVIEPAIQKVKETGRKVVLKTKFTGEYRELLDFYTDVDLICIASNADTGPSLFIEASLSNVPCISTSIGIPKWVIQNGINGIITTRNIDKFAEEICKLYDNRELLISFSKRIKKDFLNVLDNQKSIEKLKIFLEKI